MLFHSQCSLKHLTEWEEIRFRQVIIHQESLRWCAHEVIIEQNRKQSPTPLGELNFTICYNQQLLEAQLNVSNVSTTYRRRTFVNQNVLTKHLHKTFAIQSRACFGVQSSITRLFKLIRGNFDNIVILNSWYVWSCFCVVNSGQKIYFIPRSKMYNFTCHSWHSKHCKFRSTVLNQANFTF